MTDSEAEMLGVTQNDRSVLARIWLLVIIVAAMVLLSMAYIYYAGRRMAAVHGPLIDAAMEIELEATTAHLWFEEAISGDKTMPISEIIQHLDKADWYAQTMLEGGTSRERRFHPLFDSKMRGHITLVRTKLAEFEDIALERWKARDSAGAGSAIDQKFDSIFADLLEHADAVETDLQRLTNRDLENFGAIQFGLIATCVLVTVIVGSAFGRFLRRQMSDAQKLQAANRQLDAANQQLKAGEQQLRASNQQLMAHEQQLKAANQRLMANDQQLNAANQQLSASYQQLTSSEQQLRAANQQLRASQEEISALAKFPSENPSPVMRVKKDGTIIYANEASQSLLNHWSSGIGRKLPDELSLIAADAFNSGLSKKIDVDYECCSQLLTFTPIVDLDYVNIYAVDITARKVAESDLKFTQFAVDSAADAAYWMGPDARFIYVNDAACRSLGYSREELLTMTVHDIDPDFPPEVWPAHWQEVKERGSFTLESHHRTKDARVFPVEVAVNFLRFKDNEYNCAFVRDVSERKIAEEQLRQTRDNLEHTARLVTAGEMASGLAHELNQPLCAILNYANAGKRKIEAQDIDSENLREILEEIASQADRAGEIIRSLRSLIRRTEPKQEPVNINTIVREVIKLEQAEARERGVVVRTELADNIQTVMADDTQVEQVILNLARNGFEAMSETPPQNRQLIIRTAAVDGDSVEVAVCDNGKGISEDTADKIFDSFFSTRAEGLGVGLSLSRSIVEAHGGRIWAEQNANCGATVRFTLPVKGKRNG